jgi:hypothetical protein
MHGLQLRYTSNDKLETKHHLLETWNDMSETSNDKSETWIEFFDSNRLFY